MITNQETIRCEDCTRTVPMSLSSVSEHGLVCADCAKASAQAPQLFAPVWSRLWSALAGKPKSTRPN